MEDRSKPAFAVLILLATLLALGCLPACIVAPPPPPGAVIKGPPPHSNAVWVDGHWAWKGMRRVWVPGHYR
jgi:hypothetical protein